MWNVLQFGSSALREAKIEMYYYLEKLSSHKKKLLKLNFFVLRRVNEEQGYIAVDYLKCGIYCCTKNVSEISE
jgi:hypothetical protein